jgi:hypothetical protein
VVAPDSRKDTIFDPASATSCYFRPARQSDRRGPTPSPGFIFKDQRKYLCSAASVMFISVPRGSRVQFLRPKEVAAPKSAHSNMIVAT